MSDLPDVHVSPLPARPGEFDRVLSRAAARRRRRNAVVAGAFLLVVAGGAATAAVVLPGGSGQSLQRLQVAETPSPTASDEPTAEPSATEAVSPTVVPSVSPARASYAGISFQVPAGWVVRDPGAPASPFGRECVEPASPPAGSAQWWGCTGVFIEDYPVPPTQGFSPVTGGGQVWFHSTGALPCPVDPSPTNLVRTPGTLTTEEQRGVAGVTYLYDEWSASCGEPGDPPTVTHEFSPKVWWLAHPGVAIVDVVEAPAGPVRDLLASIEPVTETHSATPTPTASLPAVVDDCTAPSPRGQQAHAEPTTITVACADNGYGVAQITWTDWTTGSAHGRATVWQKLCVPNCAEGEIGHYPASITLDDVRDSTVGPLFRCLTVRYTDANPNGRQTETYDLPVPPPVAADHQRRGRRALTSRRAAR